MRLFMKMGVVVMTVAAVFCGQAKSGDSQTTGRKPAATQAPAEKKEVKQVQPAGKTSTTVQPKLQKALDTLVITARLIEIPGTMPPNDLYNYVYVMKYRLITVEKGAYDAQEILVGVYNPLIPRKQITDNMRKNAAGDVAKFVAGDKHRLALVTPIEKVWKDQVEDDYIDSDLPKYYAVRTDMAK
jgi:hypothetical protein